MKKVILSLIFSFLFITSISPACAYESEEATDLYNLGIDYYSENQIQKSIDSFKKAIEIDPKFYEAYYNLAQIQASYGHLDDAIKSYEKLIEIRPSDHESRYDFAQVLYKRGYLSRAVQQLAKIPQTAAIKAEANELTQKIKKRQAELALEAQQKERARQSYIKEFVIQKSSDELNNQKQNAVQTEVVKTVTNTVPKVTQGTITKLASPSGVAVDSKGNVYAASFSENKVYRISPLGEKAVYVDSNWLGGPISLAVDKNDFLYVANYAKNNIIKVTPSGVVSEFTQIKKPYCISLDGVNNSLIVSEQATNNVIRFLL